MRLAFELHPLSRVMYDNAMFAAARTRRAGWVVLFGLLLLLPHPLLRTPSLLFFLFFAPAAPLAVRATGGWWPTAALTTNLSPVLVGLVMLVAMLIGADPAVATWIAASVFAVAYVLFGRDFPRPDEQTRKLIRIVAIVTALTAILVFILPTVSTWWRMRADGWYHAAVLGRLAREGLPLADPSFSQVRIQYMYFFHIILLPVTKLTGFDAFSAMVLVNIAALVNITLAFIWLCGFFAAVESPFGEAADAVDATGALFHR